MEELAVVLGMHRSGTSLLARSLKVFGADLGDRLLNRCDTFNEKGYWEDRDVLQLNIAALAELGKSWNAVEPISAQDVDRLYDRGFGKQALEVLKAGCANRPLFAVKEPRITRLLPFWNRVFEELGVRVHRIFAYRNPYGVARSLERRDRMPSTQALLLWLSYNHFALKELDLGHCCLVGYESFLQTPEEHLDRLGAFLGRVSLPEERALFLKDVLDPTLCHHAAADADPDGAGSLHAAVMSLFRNLQRRSRGEEIPVLDEAAERLFTDNIKAIRLLDREAYAAKLQRLRAAAERRAGATVGRPDRAIPH